MKGRFSRASYKKIASMIIFLAILVAAIIFLLNKASNQDQIAPVQQVKIKGVFLTEPREIADFNLTMHHNKGFTKDNLKGHITLMFFGFTHCAFVCPTTMTALNKMYQLLQKQLPADQLPQVVMVSVDPERDTAELMNRYIHSFNPNFVGVSGSIAQTQSFAKQLHVVAVKVQNGADKNDYYMDHSAEILVFNREGKLQGYLSYPHQPEQMVKDYQSIISIK